MSSGTANPGAMEALAQGAGTQSGQGMANASMPSTNTMNGPDQSLAETNRLQRQNDGPGQGTGQTQSLADRNRRMAAMQALRGSLSAMQQQQGRPGMPQMQNTFAPQGANTIQAGRWMGGNQ